MEFLGFLVENGEKARILEHAKAEGFTTISEFLRVLIHKRLSEAV